MIQVTVRCYAELNALVHHAQHQHSFTQRVHHPATANALVRELGITPDDVDLLLINGESVGLQHPLREADRVSLFPVFESFDIREVTKVRSQPLRRPRFVLDVHLGKLAHHLRRLGFDTAFHNTADDAELMRLSLNESRALLSKDRELLQHEEITRKYEVKEIDPRLQLIEVPHRFDLYRSMLPFVRCIDCNTVLAEVSKDAVKDRLPVKVANLYDEFRLCSTCDRVYWKGSHYERMRDFIDDILRAGLKMRGQ